MNRKIGTEEMTQESIDKFGHLLRKLRQLSIRSVELVVLWRD